MTAIKINFAEDSTAIVAVLSSLDDFLVEVEADDGTLISGYVTAGDTGLHLRTTFRKYAAGKEIAYGAIQKIEVL